MIFIETYILNPSHVRGGENILEPITSYGGYKANINLTAEGNGKITYNNSDYTVALQGVLVKGVESTFILSNVSSGDTVQLYQDSTLVSTTQGNTISFTPNTIGEHEYYFRVNNVSTNTFTKKVYEIVNIVWGNSWDSTDTDRYIKYEDSFTEEVIVYTNEGVLAGVPITIAPSGGDPYNTYTNSNGYAGVGASSSTIDRLRAGGDSVLLLATIGPQGASQEAGKTFRYWRVYNYIQWFVSQSNYHLDISGTANPTITSNGVTVEGNSKPFQINMTKGTGVNRYKWDLQASCSGSILYVRDASSGSTINAVYNGQIHLKNCDANGNMGTGQRVYIYDANGNVVNYISAEAYYIPFKSTYNNTSTTLTNIRLKQIP